VSSATGTEPRALPRLAPGGRVTDWGRLRMATVANTARPSDEDELRELVRYAAEDGRKLTLRGVGHSAGGQSFADGAIMVDVRDLDRIIELDESRRTIRVQGGATWQTLTTVLEPARLGPATKQEFETFTIGGSIAANAHGKSIDHGPMGTSVRELRLLKADGETVTASREQNPELFRAAIGGYGLLGVIVDATLELVEDRPVENSERVFADTQPLIERYIERIHADRENTPLCYGFLDDVFRQGFYVAYTYTGAGRERPLEELERHEPAPALFNLLIALQRRSGFVRRRTLRMMWAATRRPEVTLRSRRLLLWDEPPSALERTLLQKYVVPVGNFTSFVERAGDVLRSHRDELPQVAPHFRFVPGGDEALLPLAPEDAVCLILCHLAKPEDERWRRTFEEVTGELLDACLDAGGHHYLTFDSTATREQLVRAYPRWEEFLAVKRRYDPETTFTSSFYERYAQ
jgi:decaprenylphospho-beta-D-ribofuranose 2-oxidase